MYGVLTDIMELTYNSDLKHRRTVVLFRCNWFQLGSLKSQDLEVYDNLFRSINISSYWYKDDNVILSTQATKVFYLPDTFLGKNWRVVQRFDHRKKFHVAEVENTNIAYQEVEGSDNEAVDEDMPSVTVNRPNTPINFYLVDRLKSRRKKVVEEEIDSEPEVDETIREYCSEKDDDKPADSDED